MLARDVHPGAFGENLPLRGLVERDVHIGDVLRVGGALTQVSQPRGPCFKLAARWGRRDLPARMAREGRTGFYLRVLQGGPVGAGDPIELVERRSAISVAEVLRVTYRDRADARALQAVLDVPELAEQWQAALRSLHGARRPAVARLRRLRVRSSERPESLQPRAPLARFASARARGSAGATQPTSIGGPA